MKNHMIFIDPWSWKERNWHR